MFPHEVQSCAKLVREKLMVHKGLIINKEIQINDKLESLNSFFESTWTIDLVNIKFLKH